MSPQGTRGTRPVQARRTFIRRAGAALSGPVALAIAAAPAHAASSTDDVATRLARLEDLNAIRAQSDAYLREINARPHDSGAADVIEIDVRRETATARVHCVREIEEPIGPDHPLVRMAREQGGGVLQRSEPAIVEHACIRQDGVWRIQRSTCHPA